MNPVGRCLTFDQSAKGHVRGEGCGIAALTKYGQWVDEKLVVNAEEQTYGFVSGYALSNNGKTASLTSPNAAAQQMCLHDCMRQADITPMDIDVINVHGEGNMLYDAVEVGAVGKYLRGPDQGKEEVLMLKAVMSTLAHGYEAAGISTFLTNFISQMSGNTTPNVHLRTINPHIDEDQTGAIAIVTEDLLVRWRTSYGGCSAYGFGGTNCHVLTCIPADPVRVPRRKPAFDHKFFDFWPGGGGNLEKSALPSVGYTVIGSWSLWEDHEPMHDEGDGTHTYTVTLGENRFEQFQICLDFDRLRTLHPGMPKAPTGSPVLGPEASISSRSSNWIIDGRPLTMEVPVGDVGERELDTNKAIGNPGDQYLVKLHVAGKWRAVFWEKVGQAIEDVVAHPSEVPAGRYYVCGDWNAWVPEAMSIDSSSPSLHCAEVVLPERSADFQILRDRDWNQVLYPADSFTGCAGDAAGPETEWEVRGRVWTLKGQPGDAFRIEFQRPQEEGTDRKRLSWSKLDRHISDKIQTMMPGSSRYMIVGSWDAFAHGNEMHWNGTCFQFAVEVRPGKPERFQILVNGRWDQKLFPNMPDAGPRMRSHVLCGPASSGGGLKWAIVAGAPDAAEESKDMSISAVRFMVELHIVNSKGQRSAPHYVTWTELDA